MHPFDMPNLCLNGMFFCMGNQMLFLLLVSVPIKHLPLMEFCLYHSLTLHH